MAVVVGGEEVAVLEVADDPHVHPVAVADILRDDGRGAVVEVLRRTPAGRVVDVGIGRIGSVAVLEDQVPQILRLEKEYLRGGAVAGADGGLVEVVELGRIRLAEVLEVEVDQAVARGLRRAGEDMVRAIDFDDRRIFDRGEGPAVVLRGNENAARIPCKAILNGCRLPF